MISGQYRRVLLALGAMTGLAIAPAAHATFTLTFEGLADTEPVAQYYAGGYGSYGSGPGSNFGLIATPNLWALTPTSAGGSGAFGNPPGPGDTVAVLANGASATIDAYHGLRTSLSFAFTASAAFTASVFSGLNGTGTDLLDLALAPTADLSTFALAGGNFGGYGGSIVFAGQAGTFGIDNLSSNVPEPAAFALFGLGLIGVTARRTLRQ